MEEFCNIENTFFENFFKRTKQVEKRTAYVIKN